MKKMAKQGIGLLLAILIVVQLLPVSALAEEFIQEVNVPQFYNVKFVDYDERVIVEQMVQQGKAAIPPQAPTRSPSEDEGDVAFEFNGWKRSPDGTEFGNIQADTIFTAQYRMLEKVSFSIDYVYADEEGMAEALGGKTAAPSVLIYLDKGEYLEGRYASPGIYGYSPSQTLITVSDNLSEDVAYTVTYSPRGNVNYTVNHWVEKPGVEGDPEIGNDADFELREEQHLTGRYGQSVVPEVLKLDGYTTLYVEEGPLEDDAVFNLYYARDLNTIYFESAEGSYVPPITGKYGAEITWPENPERAGFGFQGWKANASGIGENVVLDSIPEEDVTLYAGWTAEEVGYTIAYWVENPNVSGDPGNPITNPSKSENFDFWKADEAHKALAGSVVTASNVADLEAPYVLDGSTPKVYASLVGGDTITVAGDGSSVLNVYFKRITYTITFDTSAASGAGKVSLYNGTQYSQKEYYTIQAKLGQDIAGVWPVDVGPSNGKGAYCGWKVPTGYFESNDTWVNRKFSFTPDMIPKNGATSYTLSVSWGTRGIAKSLYYYLEALPDETGGLVTKSGDDGVSRQFKLKDEYTQTGLYLEFDLLGSINGTQFTKLPVDGLRQVKTEKSGTLIITGYTFYYARDRHSIIFDTRGGPALPEKTDIMVEEQLSTYDPGWTAQTAYTDENGTRYTFDGWYQDDGYRKPFNFATAEMENHSLRLYAKWHTTSITVSFDLGYSGAPVITPQVTLPGSMVQLSAPEREGYNFAGWYSDADLTQVFPRTEKVFQSRTLFAKWTPKLTRYTVRYVDETGNAVRNPRTVSGIQVGQHITESAPAIAGYEIADVDTATQTILISETDTANVITFTYTEFQGYSYTVEYLLENSGTALFPSKNVTTNATQVVEWFVADPTGAYYPVEHQITQQLFTNQRNVITFWYKEYTIVTYEANYMLMKDDGSGDYRRDDANSYSDSVRIGELIRLPSRAYEGYNENPDAAGTLTYAIVSEGDSHLVLNRFYDQRYNVSFQAGAHGAIAGETEFRGIPSGKLLRSAVELPELIPDPGYVFSDWQPSPLPDLVTESQVYTAVFVPRTDLQYSVEYYYDDVQDTEATEVFIDQTFGSPITLADVPNKMPEGYAVQRVDFGSDPEADTLSVGMGENIIRVYYVRRDDLSYTVRYLQEGTNTQIAEPTIVSGLRYQDTVTVGTEATSTGSVGLTAFPLLIDDYTFYRTGAPSLTIENREGANVVTYYYQRNLVLQAESAKETYDGAPLTAGYSYTSDALIEGDTLTVETAGSVTHVNDGVVANEIVSYAIYNGDVDVSGRYAISVLSGTLEVLPLEVEIQMADAGKAFGDPDPAFVAESIPSLPDTGLEVTGTRSNTAENVGSYPQVIVGVTNFDANTDYRLRVLPGTFTITASAGMQVSAANVTVEYNGMAHGLIAQTNGIEGAVIRYKGPEDAAGTGEDDDLYSLLNSPTYTDVGTYTVEFRAMHPNYQTAYGTANITIQQAGGLPLSADPMTVTYDGQPHGITASSSITGVEIRYRDEEGNYTLTESPVYTDVGDYEIWFQGFQDNYLPLSKSQWLHIQPADTMRVSADDVIGSYNGQPYSVDLTNAVVTAGGLNIEGAAVRFTDQEGNVLTTVPAFTEAGSHSVYFVASHPNYKDARGTAKVIINQASNMTVSANPAPVSYDGQPHGIVAGSNIAGASILYYNEGTNAYDLPTSPEFVDAGSHIVQFAAVHNNYVTVYGSATLIIEPMQVTVSVMDSSKVFGEADPEAFAYTVEPVAEAIPDGIEVSVVRENDGQNQDAGTYAGTLVATTSLDDNTNYIVTRNPGAFSITAAAALAVSAAGYSVMYDGQAHGIVAQATVADAAVRYRLVAGEGAYDQPQSPTFTEEGIYTIEFEATHKNYVTATGSATVTIEASNELSVAGVSYTATYDPQQSHGLVAVASIGGQALPIGEATILYRAENGTGYTEVSSPQYQNAGEYTFYFQASLPNYRTVEGEATLTIEQSPDMMVWAAELLIPYDGNTHYLEPQSNVEGTTFYYEDDAGNLTSEVAPGFTEVGTYSVPFEGRHPNYLPQEYLEGKVRIYMMDGMTATADSRTEVYQAGVSYTLTGGAILDGEAFDEAVITYALPGSDDFRAEPYSFSEAGIHEVLVRAEHAYYSTDTITATLVITKADGVMTVSADSYRAPYDGQPHGVEATVDETFRNGVTIRYLGPEGYTLTESPTVTEAGEPVVVQFLAEHPNYVTAYGEATIEILQAEGLTVDAEDIEAMYVPGVLQQTVAQGYLQGEGGMTPIETTIRYMDEDGDYTLATAPSFEEEGEYSVSFEATHRNYQAAYGTAQVVITASDALQVTAPEVTGTYESGRVHATTATATVDGAVVGAEIRYQDENGEYTLEQPPAFEDVNGAEAPYTVRFRARLDNYRDAFGEQTVTVLRSDAMVLTIADDTVMYTGASFELPVACDVAGAALTWRMDDEDTFNRDENPSFSEAGSYTVHVRAEHSNYLPKEAFATLTIVPSNEMMFVDAEDAYHNYTGDAYTLKRPAASNVPSADIMYGTEDGNYTSVTPPTFTDAGSHVVYFQATDKNHEPATGSAMVHIARSGGMWARANTYTTAYDEKGHGVTVLSNVEGAVIRFLDADGEYTLDRSPTGINVGEYAISFQASHPNYEPVTGSATVTITPWVVSITMEAKEKIYGEKDPAWAYQLSENVPKQLKITTLRTNAGMEEVGLYPSVLTAETTLDRNENYDIRVTPAQFEILQSGAMTVSAQPIDVLYEEGIYRYLEPTTNPVEGATITYSLTGDDGYPLLESPAYTDVSATTVYFQATHPNYHTATGSAEIRIRKSISMTVSAAELQTIYDGEAHALNVVPSVSDAIVSFRVEGAMESLPTDAKLDSYPLESNPSFTEAGSYHVFFLAQQPNYEDAWGHAWVHITKADTMRINASNVEAIYDGSAKAIAPVVTANGEVLTEGVTIRYYEEATGEFTGQQSPEFINAGEYQVRFVAQHPNYGEAMGAAVVKITRVPITVTLHDASKVFGESDSEVEFGYDLDAGDLSDASLLVVTPYREGAGVVEDAGSYEGVVKAATTLDEDPNYRVTFHAGNFEIRQADTLDISATSYIVTYDGQPHGFTVADLTCNVEGARIRFQDDQGDFTLADSSIQYTTANAEGGSYVVEFEATHPNYLSAQSRATITILPFPITVQVADAEKIYGQPDPESFTYRVLTDGDIPDAEDLEILITRQGAETSEDVDEYPEALTAAVSLGLPNYDVTVANGDFAIRQASDMVITADAIDQVYDGQEHPFVATSDKMGTTILYMDDTGDYTLDSLTFRDAVNTVVSYRATHRNYETITGFATVRIAPYTVQLLMDEKSMVYGTTPEPRFTWREVLPVRAETQETLPLPEALTVTSFRINPEETAAGRYDQVITATTNRDDDPNYNILVQNADFTITEAETLTLDVTGRTVTYDGNAYGVDVETSMPAEVTLRYGLTDGLYDLEVAPTFTEAGTHSVFVQATVENYKTATGWARVVIQPAEMEAEISAAPVVYDGQPHGIAVTSQVPGAIIRYYDAESKAYELPESPVFTDAGSHIVQYQVTHPNYVTIVGSATLSIEPMQVTVIATDMGKVFDTADPEEFAYTVAPEAGDIPDGIEVSVVRQNAGQYQDAGVYAGTLVATTSLDNDPNYTVTRSAGTFTITQAATLTVSAEGYSVMYDGQPHGIVAQAAVAGEAFADAVVRYRVTAGEGEYAQPQSPTFTEEGTYTIEFEATHKNYVTATGSATVTINPSDKLSVAGASYAVTYDPQQSHGLVAVASIDGQTLPAGEATILYQAADGTGYTEASSPQYQDAGEYTFYFQASLPNYVTATGEATLTIRQSPDMRVWADDTSVSYDGELHYLQPQSNVEGTTFFYDDGEGNLTSEVAPGFSEVGTYAVPFEGRHPNYLPQQYLTGKVRIIALDGMVATANSRTEEYQAGQSYSLEGGALLNGEVLDDATITYAQMGSNAFRTEPYSFSEAGTYQVQVRAEHAFYAADTIVATLVITKAQGIMAVSAESYSAPYDGQSHGVTATVGEAFRAGATIRYLGAEGYTLTESPTLTDASAPVTVKFMAEHPNYETAYGEATIEILQAEGLVVEAADIEAMYDPGVRQQTVARSYLQDGEDRTAFEAATVRYMDENGEYTLATAPSFEDEGEYLVSFEATHRNYLTAQGTAQVGITASNALQVAAPEVTGTYAPGRVHSTTAMATIDESVVTAEIRYMDENGEYTLEEPPAFVDVNGEEAPYTVRFRARLANYQDAFAEQTVTVLRSDAMTLTISDDIVVYTGALFELPVACDVLGATLSWRMEDEAAFDRDENPSFNEAGSYTVHVRAEHPNYLPKEAFATLTITLSQGMTYTGKGGIFTYEPDVFHQAEIIPSVDTATVVYGLKEGEYDLGTENPAFTDVGVYTVYFEISDPNYQSRQGSVIIEIQPSGAMEMGAADVLVTYDGQYHTIDVWSSVADATILYRSQEDEEGYDSADLPSFKDAGDYTIFYQVSHPNYAAQTGSAEVHITRRPVTIAMESAEKIYGEKDPDFVVASVTWTAPDDTVEVTPLRSNAEQHNVRMVDGEVVAYDGVITAATNLNERNYDVSVHPGNFLIRKSDAMQVSAENVEAYYLPRVLRMVEAQATGVDEASLEYQAVDIRYSESLSGPFESNTSPAYADQGTYFVYYEATHPNYQTVKGMAEITINKAQTMTIAAESLLAVYNGTSYALDIQANSGVDMDLTAEEFTPQITYRTMAEGPYALWENPSYTDVGTYTVYFKATHPNYEDAEGSAVIEILPSGGMEVAAENVTVTAYDGQAYSVSPVVTADGMDITGDTKLEILYPDEQGNFTSATPPSFVNAGTYLVQFLARHPNYADTENSAYVTIGKFPVRISTVHPEPVVYDGQEHAAGGAEVTSREPLPNGHYLYTEDLKVQGTDAGIYPLDITKARIISVTGGDVTDQNFEVEAEAYALVIERRPVQVTVMSETLDYNGKDRSLGYAVSETTGDSGLVSGQRLEAVLENNLLRIVGSQQVTLDEEDVTIYLSDDDGGTEVTHNYAITAVSGQLEILPRNIPVVLEAKDNSVVYDGQPHGAAGLVTETPAGLLEGHTLDQVMVAVLPDEGLDHDYRVDVGVYEDILIPSAVIIDEDGNDVTAYYGKDMLQAENGTLTIERREMYIRTTGQDSAFTYDGNIHALGFEGEANDGNRGLAAGHSLQSVELDGNTQKMAGEHPVTPQNAVILDADGVEVTDNYTIDYREGKLTIQAASVPLALHVLDQSTLYSGEEQQISQDAWQVDGQLFPGDVLEVELEGVGTDAKGYVASFALARVTTTDVDESIVDVTENYVLATNDGTFTIEPRRLIITADDQMDLRYNDAWQPDTPPLSRVTLSGEHGLAQGHVLDSINIPFQAMAIGGYMDKLMPAEAVILAGRQDVTDNYSITYMPGSMNIARGTGPALRVNGIDRTYNGAPFEVTLEGLTEGDQVFYQYGNSEAWTETPPPVYQDVVDTQISVRVENPLYEDRTGMARIRISPAQLTLTIDDAEKAWSTADPQWTSRFTGNLVAGEEPKLNKKLEREAGEAVAYYAIGQDELALVSNGAFEPSNYQLTIRKGTLTVYATLRYDNLGGIATLSQGTNTNTKYLPGGTMELRYNIGASMPGYKYMGWALDPKATTALYPGSIDTKLTGYATSIVLYPVFELRTDLRARVNFYYQSLTGGGYALEQRATLQNLYFGETIAMDDIQSLVSKYTKAGYEVGRIDNLGLSVTENADNNVISVYYRPSSNMSYTIRYYAQDESNTRSLSYVQVGSETVGGMTYGAEVRTVDESRIQANRPAGYEKGTVRTTGTPMTIGLNSTNNVVSVYYDKSAVQYRVEYYYGGVLDARRTKTLYGREGAEITHYPTSSRGGYKVGEVENLPLKLTPDGDNVIRVYYERMNLGTTIIDVPIPLGAGTGSLNVGDSYE